MNITELMQYAQENDEVDFEFVNLKGEIVKGRTLDAFMGLFKIGDNKGFITEKNWKELTGDIFDFKIIKN